MDLPASRAVFTELFLSPEAPFRGAADKGCEAVIEEARPACNAALVALRIYPALAKTQCVTQSDNVARDLRNLYYIVANTDERQTCAGALAAVLSTPEAPVFASDIDTDLRAILQSTERSVKDGLNQPEQLELTETVGFATSMLSALDDAPREVRAWLSLLREDAANAESPADLAAGRAMNWERTRSMPPAVAAMRDALARLLFLPRLWELRDVHRTRLTRRSTESPASYENQDVDGKAYVEGREFTLANLGIDFINAESAEKLLFVDDVFGRRFAYCDNYPVKTLLELIGDEASQTSQNDVARAIRLKKYPVIWGRSALGELCSGDVHFLIELVGKMVAAAGGPDALHVSNGGPAVAPKTQNETIRAEAGNFLKNLRALPVGAGLVEVVEAFGAVAASYLRHRDSKNETASPPHQASRIEPYEDPKLEGQARQVYEDLLRYSVFIEDVRGKSRRGNVVPRLYLRRFLIPFFNLTFSKRDSLQLAVEELHELLTSPKTFQDKKRLKAPDEPQGGPPQGSPGSGSPAGSGTNQLALNLPDVASRPGAKE